MRTTRSWVFSRVEPPAPYVTDTNDGASFCKLAMLTNRSSNPCALFGGKNSKLNVGRWALRMSRMFMVELYRPDIPGQTGPSRAAFSPGNARPALSGIVRDRPAPNG